MTAPMLMSHPNEETLAAYVDDRLSPAPRREVTDHLASCGECREIVLMAADFQAESNVTRGPFGKRGWIAAAAGLAAAIAVVTLQPHWAFGYDRNDVVNAAQQIDLRPSPGRVAAMAYKEKPPVYRNAAGNEDQIETAEWEKRARLYELAEKLEKRDAHLYGLALLMTGERGLLDDAIASFDAALQNAKGEERDAVAIDLAAALLARDHEQQKDAQRALALSEEVLRRTPNRLEAAWNRAEALARIDPAKGPAAWNEYLKLDPDSQWANEARERLRR